MSINIPNDVLLADPDEAFVHGLAIMMYGITQMVPDEGKQSQAVFWVKKIMTEFEMLGFTIEDMSRLMAERQRPKV